MINPFINKTENRLSKTELIKSILMTVSGIALARMILVLIFLFLMLFTLFLTSIGYYSNDENLGRCARFLSIINQFGSNIVKRFTSVCCRNQSANTSNFHEMSRIRRCLLFLVQVFARCIMYVLGYWYINEKFPGHKNWLVFPSYMERTEATKICIANHVSFIDAFYFLSRCVPRSVVIQANVIKPFRWAFNAFSPIIVPVTEKQRRKLKLTKELIHKNLESNIFKRPLIIFPEGDTSESNTLIKFQDGAFIDLQSIQPIALKYTYKRFDPSWSNDISPLWLLYRMCCQFVNYLSVEYYDIVSPDIPESNIIQNNNINANYTFKDRVIIEMEAIETNNNKTYEPNIIINTHIPICNLSGESKDDKNINCYKSTIDEEIMKKKHAKLVEDFKNKVFECYLSDPFFIKTAYSLSDSRITSKLKRINKIPVEYVSEQILKNGMNGVTKICETTSIKRTDLEKIIIKFYKCNNTNATLDIIQFNKFMEKSDLFDINKLFNTIKTMDKCVTFNQVINMLKHSSDERILSCARNKGDIALKLHDSLLKQILYKK